MSDAITVTIISDELFTLVDLRNALQKSGYTVDLYSPVHKGFPPILKVEEKDATAGSEAVQQHPVRR